MKKGHGLTIYSKSDSNFGKKGANIARRWSNVTYSIIENERKKALNPPKKQFGPRITIINYIKFMKEMGRIDVTDENIIEHMEKIFPKLDREYIQTLIDQIRRQEEQNDERNSGKER